MTPQRITLRLGNLSEPLGDAATESGRSLSEEIRYRLAESLGVDPPEMPQGFAAMDASTAARARQKSGESRRKSSQTRHGGGDP